MAALRRDHPLPSIAAAFTKLERAGNELKGCCPFHDERTPSFTIFAGGERWQCFGCGAGGDVVDFVRQAHGLSFVDAAKSLAADALPIVDAPSVQLPAKEDRCGEAREIWRAARPIVGTLAENYLRTRGLHLPLPETLRFAELRYGKRGRTHPCLVAAVASVESRFIGIQRTYLNDAGTGKAAVPKPKLSLGRISGGAIRLAPAARYLNACEGLEDGLTLAQERGAAVWVAAGAGNLARMQFPPIVEAVTIGGDNDATGRAEAQKAADALAARGIKSRCVFPADAKDFNAELQGRAR